MYKEDKDRINEMKQDEKLEVFKLIWEQLDEEHKYFFLEENNDELISMMK